MLSLLANPPLVAWAPFTSSTGWMVSLLLFLLAHPKVTPCTSPALLGECYRDPLGMLHRQVWLHCVPYVSPGYVWRFLLIVLSKVSVLSADRPLPVLIPVSEQSHCSCIVSTGRWAIVLISSATVSARIQLAAPNFYSYILHIARIA